MVCYCMYWHIMMCRTQWFVMVCDTVGGRIIQTLICISRHHPPNFNACHSMDETKMKTPGPGGLKWRPATGGLIEIQGDRGNLETSCAWGLMKICPSTDLYVMECMAFFFMAFSGMKWHEMA